MDTQDSIQNISVFEFNQVQVTTAKTFFDNGVAISKTINIYQILPGDIFYDKDLRVQNICRAVHTSEVIKKFKDQLEYQNGAGRQKIQISRSAKLGTGV